MAIICNQWRPWVVVQLEEDLKKINRIGDAIVLALLGILGIAFICSLLVSVTAYVLFRNKAS